MYSDVNSTYASIQDLLHSFNSGLGRQALFGQLKRLKNPQP